MTQRIENRLLKVNEVAEMTGCHRNTIWNHIKSGKLRAVRSGRRIVRLRESDVSAFFSDYKTENIEQVQESAAFDGNFDVMKYWSNIGAKEERQKIVEQLKALKLELINEAQKLSGTQYEASGQKTASLALGVEEAISRIRRQND